jgi:hypothetical protein
MDWGAEVMGIYDLRFTIYERFGEGHEFHEFSQSSTIRIR